LSAYFIGNKGSHSFDKFAITQTIIYLLLRLTV